LVKTFKLGFFLKITPIIGSSWKASFLLGSWGSFLPFWEVKFQGLQGFKEYSREVEGGFKKETYSFSQLQYWVPLFFPGREGFPGVPIRWVYLLGYSHSLGGLKGLKEVWGNLGPVPRGCLFLGNGGFLQPRRFFHSLPERLPR